MPKRKRLKRGKKLKLKHSPWVHKQIPSEFDMLNSRLMKIEQDIGVMKVMLDMMEFGKHLPPELVSAIQKVESNGQLPR